MGTGEWGYTVPPSEGGGDVMVALAEADEPKHGDHKGPVDWLKKNLFNTWYNTIITIVFGAFAIWAGYYALRFVFVTARWEPVEENLELFMIGLFPREERTRLIVQLFLWGAGGGLFAGWLRQRSIIQAEQAGLERQKTTWREYFSTYWALGLFFLTCLVLGSSTISPWLIALGCVAAAIAGYVATKRHPHPALRLVLFVPFGIAVGVLSRIQDLDNSKAYLIAAVCTVLLFAVSFLRDQSFTLSMSLLAGVAGFQSLSGTGGIAWLFALIALLPFVLHVAGRLADDGPDWVRWAGVALVAGVLVWRIAVGGGISIATIVLALLTVLAVVDAVNGTGTSAIQYGLIAGTGALSFAVTRGIDLEGIDWREWNGLHLNLVVAGAAIVLAFPVGLLLALGRRSKLPVLRWMSTVYIETIRGVPLISLLLMGDLFIGFFIGTDVDLSKVTKATAAITMFSAAYIAEIVRGGLQAVATGQTEAGQALGLPPAKITRLLVLPQALRAVIPAMVGQFISLFKDTSLLAIIAIPDFLGIREIVHGQEAFRGFGIAETLVFVAFGFWAFSFTMSRESQRLERRLGVGVR